MSITSVLKAMHYLGEDGVNTFDEIDRQLPPVR